MTRDRPFNTAQFCLIKVEQGSYLLLHNIVFRTSIDSDALDSTIHGDARCLLLIFTCLLFTLFIRNSQSSYSFVIFFMFTSVVCLESRKG